MERTHSESTAAETRREQVQVALEVLCRARNGEKPAGEGMAYGERVNGLFLSLSHDGSFSCVRERGDPDYRPIVAFSARDTQALYEFWRGIVLAEILELAARKAEKARAADNPNA